MNEYLAIYHPQTVWSAKVNATSDKGDIDLTVTGISGSYTSVLSGMTAVFGSTYGAHDTRSRVRSAGDGTLKLAEHDTVFVSGTFVSVLAQWDLWPVYPNLDYIDEQIIEYKDKDIAYTDQNTEVGVIPIAGSHTACFAGDDVLWSASGTFSLGNSAMSYAWTLNGTLSGTSSVQIPGAFSYPTPGHYYTKLVVTDANSNTQSTYRYVSVLDKSNLPYRDWGREAMTGSRGSGGWSVNIWVRDGVGDVNANDIVIVFTDDEIPHANQSGRAKTLMVGYVQEGSIVRNWQDGKVNFTVVSANGILRKTESYGISLVSSVSGTASQWYEMDNLSIKRGFWEFLRYNTSILNSVDVYMPFTDVLTEYFDTNRAYIWDVLRTTAEATYYGDCVCDRLNSIYIEDSPARKGTDVPIRAAISRKDWMGAPEIEETPLGNVSYLEVGGMIYNGDVTDLRIAAAPGNVPAYFGGAETIGGLSVASMTELLQATANIYAFKNAQYPNTEMRMSAEHWYADIAPLQALAMTMAASESPRALDWSAKPLYISDLDIDRVGEAWRSIFDVSAGELKDGTDSEEIILPAPTVDNFPDLPWPTITGTFWQPQFPQVPQEPDATPPKYVLVLPPPSTACITDDNYIGNGPFNTGVYGTFTTSDYLLPWPKFHGSFWIRKASHVNRTKYLLNAKFEKLNTTTGVYEETLDDNFYSIVLMQGTDIVQAGARQSFTDPRFREGLFTGDGSLWADGLRLYINSDSGDFDTAVGAYAGTLGTLVSSGPVLSNRTPVNNKSVYTVENRMEMYRATSQYIDIRLVPEAGKTFAYGYFYVTGYASMIVTGGEGYHYDAAMAARRDTGNVVYLGTPVYSGDQRTVTLDIEPTLFHFNTNYAQLWYRWSAVGPRISTLKTPTSTCYMKLTTWRAAQYRISIYGLYLYNICVREGGDFT